MHTRIESGQTRSANTLSFSHTQAPTHTQPCTYNRSTPYLVVLRVEQVAGDILQAREDVAGGGRVLPAHDAGAELACFCCGRIGWLVKWIGWGVWTGQ